MIKNTEWPIKDYDPEKAGEIAELENRLRSLSDADATRVKVLINELRTRIFYAENDILTEMGAETDRAALVHNVVSKLDEKLQGKRNILTEIFSVEQIAILILQNEAIIDKTRECVDKGLTTLNQANVDRDGFPSYTIENLTLAKEASGNTLHELVRIIDQYSLHPEMGISEADRLLRVPPIGRDHEFLLTHGTRMPETAMHKRVDTFLRYIEPVVENRARGLGRFTSYNIHEVALALAAKLDYFHGELVEIQETAQDIVSAIRRYGHEHPVIKRMGEAFNIKRKRRTFLEEDASTKTVLLTLKGRLEFGIEPGNQIYSEELSEDMIRQLLRVHMQRQRAIGNKRKQIQATVKPPAKAQKGPKELALRYGMEKRKEKF